MDPALMALQGTGIFGNPWQPQFPNTSIPGMNGPLGAMLGIGLQSWLQGQGNGLMGLQFMGNQNLYDTMQMQQMMNERMAAMTQASMQDKLRFKQMARGATELLGGTFGPDQAAAADRLGGVLTGQMGNVFAMTMPDFYDKLFGLRGSAAVMANRMFEGGRFTADPVTGLPGYTGETAGFIARRVHEDLFGTDPNDQRFRQMRGISAGQVGGMFDELTRRGFMRSGGTEGLGPDASAGDLREAEVRRVGGQLKNLAGAVAAMRDIFGDAGRPDAPMREIMNGLQALTQGGLANMNPEQLQSMVRKTQMLGRMTSMSVGAVMQVQAQGVAVAQQMGLDPRFAVLASQHAMGMGAAFTSSAANTAGLDAFGALDKESLISLDQQLTLSAARSPMANNLNAIMAMKSLFGNRKGFAGSDLALAAAAIENGQETFTNSAGRTVSLAMGFNDLRNLARSGGVSEGNLNTLLSSPLALQEMGAKYNTGAIARRMQYEVDLKPQMVVALQQQLAQIGIKDPTLAATLADQFSRTPGIAGMSNADAAAAMIAGAGIGAGPGMDISALQGAVGLSITQFDELSRQHTGVGWRANAQLHSRQLADSAIRQIQIAANRGELASALAGLGQGGSGRNFFEFVASQGKGATMEGFLTSVFGGGVAFDEAKAALGAPTTALMATYKEWMESPQGSKRREELAGIMSTQLGQMMPMFEKLSPETRRKAQMHMALNDETLMGVLAATSPGTNLDPIRKALQAATPEQRLAMLEAAQGFSASQAVGQSMITGDAKAFISQFVGEQGLKAAGLAAQEVKLAPGTKMELEDKLYDVIDGIVKFFKGMPRPAGARSTGN